MQDNALYQAVTDWAGDNAWIVQVFVVVFLVLLFNLVLRVLLRRLHNKLKDTDNPWDDALVDALQRPLNLMVWVIGIAFAAEIVHAETEATIFKAIGPIRDVGVIACLTWFLQRLVKQVQINILRRSKGREQPLDQTTVDAIGKLVSAAIMITAALVVLQTLGFSISGVLAFGGIGGIAIGFAAKDLLSNLDPVSGPGYRGHGGIHRLAPDAHPHLRQAPGLCPERHLLEHRGDQPVTHVPPAHQRDHRYPL